MHGDVDHLALVVAETKAAVVTFIVAASGVTFAGVGAAPWSLAAGLAILGLHRLFDRPKAARR